MTAITPLGQKIAQCYSHLPCTITPQTTHFCARKTAIIPLSEALTLNFSPKFSPKFLEFLQKVFRGDDHYNTSHPGFLNLSP